jgi:hypothetical protein
MFGACWKMRGPCHVRGLIRFPFRHPFPIILLLGESISMALQLFFCVAHGNCPSSYLLACSGSSRCKSEKKEKITRNGFVETWRGGTRDINSVSDSLHLQVSSRAWLHVSRLQPLTSTISKMSSTFHFISNEIYAIANSREVRQGLVLHGPPCLLLAFVVVYL